MKHTFFLFALITVILFNPFRGFTFGNDINIEEAASILQELYFSDNLKAAQKEKIEQALHLLNYEKQGDKFVNSDNLFGNFMSNFNTNFPSKILNSSKGNPASPFSIFDDDMSINLNFSKDIEIKFEEKNNYLLVKCTVENLKDNKIDIKIDGRTFTISGTIEKVIENNSDSGTTGFFSKQNSYSHFQRSVSLPVDVEEDPVKTEINKKNIVITLKKK